MTKRLIEMDINIKWRGVLSNIIFIIVDSLSYERIYNRNDGELLIPFLSSIKDECILATNLYSQGPYTEAGTKGLLCSCDTLDHGGYFLRYDTEEKFITDIFKEAGYETYNINAPSYLLSKRTLNNIDHIIYTSGFDCRFLWSQRFEFYYDIWKSGNLSEDDYDYLSRFIQLVFESAEDYFEENCFESKHEAIKDIIDMETIIFDRQVLLKEKNDFLRNKEAYIDSIFEMKMRHPIFKVKNVNISKMIKTEQIKKILNKNKDLSSKIIRIQFWSNLVNNHCSRGFINRLINNIKLKKRSLKDCCGEILNRIRNIICGREFEVFRTGLYYTGDPYKLVPSAKTQFEIAANLLEKNSDGSFIFLHLEEPHYFNTFFSYDVSDEKVLLEEFDYAKEYISKINKNYKGSLFYDLSVRYIDKQIEVLYNRLKKGGYLDNTLVVITADHGSSYFFNPIRQVLVNNMHAENYHVPLYIFGSGIQPNCIDKMCMGKDVIPTIADILGFSIGGGFKGHSLLDRNYCDDSVMIEFMGSGCPDIRLKPVWLSARSLEYAVSYIGYLKDEFNPNNITEIYDLNTDPLELKNINYYRNDRIEKLIERIRNRFIEIKYEQDLAREA